MNTTEESSHINRLFSEAARYAKLVIENLLLEPEGIVHVDPYITHDAFAHRGFPRTWEWTPRMVMELRRDTHVIHFLFPNLTDQERTLLLALRDACHRLKVYRRSNDPSFLGWERWFATRQAGQCEEDYEQCRQAIEEADIQRKLTAVQLELANSDYFNANATLKVDTTQTRS